MVKNATRILGCYGRRFLLMAGLGSAVATGVTTAALASNPVGWAVGGLMALGSVLGAGSKQKEAKAKMGYIGEQQAGIQSALGQLGETTAMKTELAEDVYGTGLGQTMFQTGQNLYGLTRQGQTAASRVGFARSGQLESQMQRGQEAGVASFGFQRQSLQDVLGQKLMDIEEFRGGEEGRLQAEESRLAYEMEQQKQKASTGGFFQSLFGG